jgi:hypothetical protein
MINAVIYKTPAAYKKALSDTNILQTHEPFNMIVYNDPIPVNRNFKVIDRIIEVTDINKIPTGKAIFITNHVSPEISYQRGRYAYAEQLLKDKKYRVDFSSVTLGVIVVQMPPGLSFSKVEDLIDEELYGTPVFSAIEEDVIFTAQPADYVSWPIGSQWHLKDIESPQAYASFANGVIYNSIGNAEWFTKDVAILDGTGIEIDHPDLLNTDRPVDHPGYRSTRASWNCVNNTASVPAVGPNENHGTVMTGIAGSQWADHRFLRGVGLDHINVQYLRIGYNVGPTGSFNTTPGTIYRALIKAVFNENCASIAMPFVWNFYFAGLDGLLTRITKYTRANKGIPIFAPSGNAGANSITSQFPGAYESVLVIGSSNQDHERSTFSNYGGNIFAAAPGEGILAIDRLSVRGYNQNPDPNYGSVTYFSGTSASCVIAATIAATMTVAYPGISFVEIKYALAETARRIGPYTYTSQDPNNQLGVSNGISDEFGNGILTQYDAILKALELSEQFLDISVAITGMNFRWSETFATTLSNYQLPPLISGARMAVIVELEVTNNSPNPITYTQGTIFPVRVFLATDDTGNLSSIFRMFFPSVGLNTNITILPGETAVFNVNGRTIDNPNNCNLNGLYYAVAKYTNPLISSAEEVTYIEDITFDNVSSDVTDIYCNNGLMPVYNDAELRISNLQVTRIGTTSQFNITIRLINIGSNPVYGCRIKYEWYPTGSGLNNTLNDTTIASFESGVFYYSSYYVSPDISYYDNPALFNNDYDEYIDYINGWPVPSAFTPNMPVLQAGQSAIITIPLFMNPIMSPTFLVANLTAINQVLIENFDPINHFTQSPVLLIE